MQHPDVVIVGAGPTGLAATRRLKELGVKHVVVLEREAEAGGIPRYCGHLGFGWHSHKRMWRGPHFAYMLRASVEGVDMRTATSVLEINRDGSLRLHSASGVSELKARHILIATGTREASRAARLVGGARPQGVMNTGALQQHVYLHGRKPFQNPVIIGSEWVSFSAILTCRHAGIRPVAMLEENQKITAPRAGSLVARWAFGVPVYTSAKLISIEGRDVVEAVEIEHRGQLKRITCDGVIFTGQFKPETAILPAGDLPENISLAGNVLAPLKSAGQCWLQGVAAAEAIAGRLA